MKIIRNLAFGILATISLSTMNTNLLAQVINEVQTDNPGTDVCEYIELRGTAGMAVGADLYLVEIEGDGSAAGVADFVRDVSADSFGTNGILSIVETGACTGRDYTSDGGNSIVDSNVTFENGTLSFLLIRSPVMPMVQGTDYDTNNDGTLDALPPNAVVVDAVGWTDGGGSDIVYGGVDVTPGTGTPDAATRNFNNITPLMVGAWFADVIVGDPQSVLYSQTNLVGPFVIDFLTPGRQNLAPTAAAGIISGRARTSSGRGVKHAVIMLTGGNLQEPIYATTNQFGNYRFEDIAVGQTYVLQILSGRYTFQNPSMLVNLDESLTNADFIVSSGDSGKSKILNAGKIKKRR